MNTTFLEMKKRVAAKMRRDISTFDDLESFDYLGDAINRARFTLSYRADLNYLMHPVYFEIGSSGAELSSAKKESDDSSVTVKKIGDSNILSNGSWYKFESPQYRYTRKYNQSTKNMEENFLDTNYAYQIGSKVYFDPMPTGSNTVKISCAAYIHPDELTSDSDTDFMMDGIYGEYIFYKTLSSCYEFTGQDILSKHFEDKTELHFTTLVHIDGNLITGAMSYVR